MVRRASLEARSRRDGRRHEIAASAAGDLTAVEKDRVDRRVAHALQRFANGRMPKPKSLCKVAEKIVAF
jgi:hypothetical protein